MPPKIRELIKKLEKAGFEVRGGKGSHRNFKHPKGPKITLRGNPEEDAKAYQERDMERAIREATR